jgi:serine phosphatase RsbU (regulator of sigma subunit)
MRLNVLQKFTLLSIAVTIVIVVGLGFLVSALLTRWLLANEIEVTADALATITRIDLPPDTFIRAIRERDTERFDYLWRHVSQMPDVLRVKIYDGVGRIVWSDEKLLINQIFEDNQELKEALRGKVVAEIGKAKREHEYETPLVPEEQLLEVYVPLFDTNSTVVYGVFELYKRPVGFFRKKHQLQAIVLLSGLGGGIILFLSLFGLFRNSLREQMRLQEIEAQYAEVEFELNLAGEIQRGLLPAELPEIPAFDVAAFHQPTREVGGDYYDVFPGEDGSFLLAVADSEGRSIPAALLMVETWSVLAAEAPGARSVSATVAAVNRFLAATNETPRLVTMFLARLEPTERVLTYSSAGHCPALRVRGSEATRLGEGGPPMGIAEQATYEEGSIKLAPGDVVLIYTDGVTESQGADGELFGTQRLQDLLCAVTPGQAAKDVIDRVCEGLAEFTGEAALVDDTTIVCLVAR